MNADSIVALQWLAVKDLAADEWYMVEVTDLTNVDLPPRRGFTRATSLQIPETWLTAEAGEPHQYRWRVSIVKKVGERSDGQLIYTYGGRASEDGIFYWGG